jgi:hypothetical protein
VRVIFKFKPMSTTIIHNAIPERRIIGLTQSPRAEGTVPRAGAQLMPENGSQGPRGCVEPIITIEVWCYDIISQQSQREKERERKRERETRAYLQNMPVLFVQKRERKGERES